MIGVSHFNNANLLNIFFFLFVKIRSVQVGFEDWKQVGFFIKHSGSNVLKKFSRLLLSIIKLKSPISIVLSYWQVNWPNVFDKGSIKYSSFWDGRLYIPTHSHLWFLTVNSYRINSMSMGNGSKDRTLLGIRSLTKNISPPPNLSLSLWNIL